MRLTPETVFPNDVLHRLLSRWWAGAAVAVGLAVIFAVDRNTGAAPYQHLFYLPIIFAGAQFGYRGGLVVAVAAVFLYHAANPHLLTFRYEERDVVQVMLFIAVGLVSAKFARDARHLHRLATTDDLTGLHNLRSFEARLKVLASASLKTGEPLALLVVDVDRLKSLNDAYSHLTGAEAVQTVGHIIDQRLPDAAIACRYGGDEFVIAVPNCTEATAAAFADELRRDVHESAPVLDGMPFPAGTLSISVGIACRPIRPPRMRPGAIGRQDASGTELFREADAALYVAKRAGRNQVSIGRPAA